MPDKQTQTSGDSYAELYKFALFVAVALGITLYLHILRNRKYWVTMEVVLGVFHLIAFPFCQQILTLFYGAIDDSHHAVSFMTRLVLLGLIAQAVVIYMTRDSEDPTVGLSVSVSNILTRGMILFAVIAEMYYGKTFRKAVWTLRVDMISFALLMLGDLFHMSKLTTNEGSRTVGDPISFHLSVDAMLSFFLGSLIFGFSDMFLGILNPAMNTNLACLFLSKFFGSIILGGSVLSFASLCFKYDNDAITTLKSKLAIYLPIILLAATHAFTDKYYRGVGHSAVMFGVFGLLACNAGYAVWNYEQKKRD